MAVKKTCETLFFVIVFCFSAVMIVLSLLFSINITAINDQAEKLQKQIEALKIENEILRAEYENSISLEEIERYATHVLGMQRRSPGQIQYIELPEMTAD